MADFSIKDGSSGNIAQVDELKNLHVQSVSEPLSDHACERGFKFNINTGDITLTDAGKTSMLYMKNTGSDPVVITSLIYNLGATTSGTGDVKIDVLRNPTAGDIITNANNVAVGVGVSANQNFSSSETFTGLAYKGATSEGVFSDGDLTITTRSVANTGRIFISLGAVELPKGSSIGIEYTPPASNSSQIVQFAMSCYIRTQAVAIS